MRICSRCLTVLLFATLVAGVVGCAGSDGRIPIEGTVTYKGQLLASGSIKFIPKENTKGTMEGALLVDGKYALPARNGLIPGAYHVSISSVESTGPKPAPDAPPGSPKRGKELLPAKYNTNSQLSIEVTATGERKFDFNLD